MLDLKRRGKAKEVINNLNLVPFIDLFSTLIIFLMATAVFDKLASVPVNMGSNDQSSIKVPDGGSSTKKIVGTVTVTVTTDTIIVSDSGSSRRLTIASEIENEYQGVAEFMSAARARHRDLRELIVNVTDKAKYGAMVAVMDEALAVDFDQLVVTGDGQ